MHIPTLPSRLTHAPTSLQSSRQENAYLNKREFYYVTEQVHRLTLNYMRQ